MRIERVRGVCGVRIADLKAHGYRCAYEGWQKYPAPPPGIKLNLNVHFTDDYFANQKLVPNLGVDTFHKARIIAMLALFGKDDSVVVPIWVNVRSKQVEGNHRWAALEHLGYDWLPVTACPDNFNLIGLTCFSVDDMIIKTKEIRSIKHGV